MKKRPDVYGPTYQEVLKANIEYHSALAETYDTTQPHYRPENVERVGQTLNGLAQRTAGKMLLDIGCGTGFIINIARRCFNRVVGVDVTRKMLDKVEVKEGNVQLVLADSAAIPFPAETFDVCTAYGVLHHLQDLGPTLREAFRCLQPGGIFYADQDPNRYYWELMHQLAGLQLNAPVVQQEVESVLKICETLEASFGLDPQTVALAEYQKIERNGFREEELVGQMEEAGFVSIELRYEWFLGQGAMGFDDHSAQKMRVIENYLRDCLPATRHLFKYVKVLALKPLREAATA